jgi:hypothetical protein
MSNIICPHCRNEIDRALVAQQLGQSGGQANAAKHGAKLRAMAKMAAQKRWAKERTKDVKL